MVPEGRGVFTRMTITENLQIGAYIRKDKAEIAKDMDRVFATFPRLKERAHAAGRHHVRRRAADAGDGPRADGRPKVLLLDEPSMGLSPIMVDKIFEVVKQVYDQGVTVLLVEQNASRALQLADRGYVMESGLITMSGDAKVMLSDPEGARGLPGRVNTAALAAAVLSRLLRRWP